MAKIYIAIPTYDRRVDMEILSAIVNIQSTHRFSLDFIAGSIITNGRNYLVKRFLETDCEYLYFWDSDVVIRDPFFMDKLLDTSEKLGAKIVGGAYRIKSNHKEYAIGMVSEDGKSITNKKLGELTDPQLVDVIATGSMLIHRDVFSKVSDPWFEFIEKAGGGVLPEDYNFCKKAKSKGILVAVDPRFDTFHFGYSFWQHSEKFGKD